jgi:NAD(P) transhydrogenase subunit alpha
MAGYKAVLIAAQLAPRFFPMLTTAAGTIRPSKVLVIGAGVAGLQAIAHRAPPRRAGRRFRRAPGNARADRIAGRESSSTSACRRRARAATRAQLTAEESAEQQRRLAEHLRTVDVVVTTAAIPGRAAPKIITMAMVANLKPGSVVVDLAAETGGNCEATRPGENIDIGGVTVAGPLNLASMGALHASEMYARNVYNFLALMLARTAS